MNTIRLIGLVLCFGGGALAFAEADFEGLATVPLFSNPPTRFDAFSEVDNDGAKADYYCMYRLYLVPIDTHQTTYAVVVVRMTKSAERRRVSAHVEWKRYVDEKEIAGGVRDCSEEESEGFLVAIDESEVFNLHGEQVRRFGPLVGGNFVRAEERENGSVRIAMRDEGSSAPMRFLCAYLSKHFFEESTKGPSRGN